MLAIWGLRKCAVCSRELQEYREGEFSRYYCGECDISYYVYDPGVEVYSRSLIEMENIYEDDLEECFLGQGTVLSLILIVVLELIYHMFFT
ncbi:MAG: hypothetical protein QXK89_00370 [Candidatus Bathyarchaeia archaeon]